MIDRLKITTTIDPDRPERMLEWIVSEQFDCGITDRFDGYPTIEHEAVEIRTDCIFPQRSPLIWHKVISPRELIDQKIMLTKMDSAFFRTISDALYP